LQPPMLGPIDSSPGAIFEPIAICHALAFFSTILGFLTGKIAR